MIVNARERLREIAQLWAFGQRLPHIPTPAERILLEEFRALSTGRTASCSLNAARAGMLELWRKRELVEITRVGRLLPERLRDDREIGAHIAHARQLLEESPAGAE